MKSIIIPTYNHYDDFLKPCLESIIKYTDLSDVEIIVVANGCTDETEKYVLSLRQKNIDLLWFDEGLGYTKATNLGVKSAKGDIIILMNNDVVLLPQKVNEWMEFLCNPLKDKVGVTCNLKLYDESSQRHFAVGFLLATTRNIWNKIGGLNEEWNEGGGGGEDIEFCIKVEELGYKILQVPDENNQVINGINVNRFMSYHKGEGTMMDTEHKDAWVKHIDNVRKKLESKFRLPEGWFYGEDIVEYRRLIEDVPDGGTMIELGCYKGRSLCSVSDIIKRKKLNVYVVDVFTGTVSEGHREEDYQKTFEDNCYRFGIKPEVYHMTTDEAVCLFLDGEFDFIFIDADHQYEAIKNDITKWLPKLKENGVISGHDYGTHPGISKAVNERFDNTRVHGYIWSKRI